MNIKKVCIPLILAVVLCMVPNGAKAVTMFTADLTGSQEVPANASTATGFGTFTLNDTMTELSFAITYSGLLAGAIASHFHSAPAGVNGPVVRSVPIVGGSFSGSLLGAWTNLDPQPLTPALVNSLLLGDIYFNIHTIQFPGGEIRGQIQRVPVPSSLLLLGSGLAGLVACRKHHRQA